MNDTSVLVLSALTLDMQVKVDGEVYLIEENRHKRLVFSSCDSATTLKLSSTTEEVPLSFSDFLKLSERMSQQERIELHDSLSQRGALTHG